MDDFFQGGVGVGLGTSKTSSSWTWMRSFKSASAGIFPARISRWILIMAILIISAAEPWTTVLTAVRSAKARVAGVLELISGMARRRSIIVTANAGLTGLFDAVVDEGFHLGISGEIVVDELLGLGPADAEGLGQAVGPLAVDDAEVDGLGDPPLVARRPD